MNNIIHDMITEYKRGVHVALPSYCTGNRRVIEAILRHYKDTKEYVLLEATANQVNQFGGYTGMKPADYRNMVFSIARQVDFDSNRILLGGDHLGPLVWSKEPEVDAMKKAVELVTLFVKAGYQKIHLDTSMRLGDDSLSEPLTTETIARRGAVLFKACEDAFAELLKTKPDAVHPVYIVGSEVPIPGGASGGEEHGIIVTKPEDFISTVVAYKGELEKQGIGNFFKDVVGIVVQPGVEFDNDGVQEFNTLKAKYLSDAVRKFGNIVFEGHSTDYQSPFSLKEMVKSGVFILKVGPALTFAYREAILCMEKIVAEITGYHGFTDALLCVMNGNDKDWRNHYDKNLACLKAYQLYSFSDRCRYYIGDVRVKTAIAELKDLFDKNTIPLFLVHQYLPLQYYKIRDKKVPLTFDAVIDDMIGLVLDNYLFASGKTVGHDYYI